MSIRTRAQSNCSICGDAGERLYSALTDRLLETPARWSLRRCRNRGCGLIWLDPVPVEADIHKAYETYYTHAPTASSTSARRLYAAIADAYIRERLSYSRRSSKTRRLLVRLVEVIHPGGDAELLRDAMYLPASQAGALVLDVGCGGGHLLAYLQGLGWNAEGIDVDPAAVEAARRKGLNARVGDLALLNYPDDYVDAICLAHVIEHVHQPLALLLECRRILKPGGRLVVATPNSDSLGHRRFRDAWISLDPPRHLFVFRIPCLSRVARDAGLSISQLTTTVRGARSSWFQSREIRRTGRWDVNRGAPGLRSHVAAIPFQLIERMVLRFNDQLGEELLLVATKTD